MIRVPWWGLVLIFAAGYFLPQFLPNSSKATLRVTRDSLEMARVEGARLQEVADNAVQRNLELWESYENEQMVRQAVQDSLRRFVVTTTSSAQELAAVIRARVDSATAVLVTEMQEQYETALQVSEERYNAEHTARLEAEAGWRDSRLAVSALTDEVTNVRLQLSLERQISSVLQSELNKKNRRSWIERAVGLTGWLAYISSQLNP